MALEEMHLNHDIPDPAQSVADLPEGLRRLVIKSCRRDPDRRYDNFEQVLADLRQIARADALSPKKMVEPERKRNTDAFL